MLLSMKVKVKVTFYSVMLWNNHLPIRYRHRKSGSTTYRLQASAKWIVLSYYYFRFVTAILKFGRRRRRPLSLEVTCMYIWVWALGCHAP